MTEYFHRDYFEEHGILTYSLLEVNIQDPLEIIKDFNRRRAQGKFLGYSLVIALAHHETGLAVIEEVDRNSFVGVHYPHAICGTTYPEGRVTMQIMRLLAGTNWAEIARPGIAKRLARCQLFELRIHDRNQLEFREAPPVLE